MSAYPHATWRLLVWSAPADGATQMATDEAIWRAVGAGRAPATLRLYRWAPPCLSLGRNQPASEVDAEALEQSGYELVRRPSGGRAILHIDELTYAVALPLRDPRARGGVLGSCHRLSQGLLEALRLLGAEAAVQQNTARPATAPVCFEQPGAYEIVWGGRKLVGSAQVRGRGALLQHGALPLYGDIARICRFLTPTTSAERVRARAITLSEALGRAVSWEESAAAIAQGFASALDLSLLPGQLSDEEQRLAKALRERKYRAREWNWRI